MGYRVYISIYTIIKKKKIKNIVGIGIGFAMSGYSFTGCGSIGSDQYHRSKREPAKRGQAERYDRKNRANRYKTDGTKQATTLVEEAAQA